MNYPTFVYKSPGYHAYPKTKKTYQYIAVQDDDELKQRLNDGWFATCEQALGLEEVEEVKTEVSITEPEAPEIKEDAAPTRAELEQKAKELSIKFDGRTSDSRLLKLITERVSNELD